MKKFLPIVFVPFLLYACGSSTEDDVSGDIRAKEEDLRDFSASQMQKMKVKTKNGDVKSSAWDDDSIHVVFEKWATGDNEEDAGRNINDITMSITEDTASGVLNIEVDMPTSGEPDYGCNVSLSVPSSLSLDLESSNGNIEIEGTEADATLETSNGKIIARNHRGQLDGSTSNGDINVDMVLPDDGECILKTSNGSITLSIPDTTSASIDASTSNGKVETEGLDVTVSQESDKELVGEIGDGEGDIELQTSNGNILIKSR